MSEQTHFEIPKDVRSMAEASFDQARRAFEKFIDNAQATADQISARTASVRAGAKDVGAVTLSFAEKNVRASLDYAESILHAKDLSEVLRLQREYVQNQMRSLPSLATMRMGPLLIGSLRMRHRYSSKRWRTAGARKSLRLRPMLSAGVYPSSGLYPSA